MARRSRTRDEQKARTRNALLKAARELVARHGVEGTSLDRIAARAGYTKGAVYAHFTSKDALLDAVLDSLSLSIEFEDVTDVNRPLDEQFYALGVRIAQEGRALSGTPWRLAQEIVQFALRNRKARSRWVSAQRRGHAAAGRKLEEAEAAAGHTLPLSGREMVIVLNALAVGLIEEQMLDPESIPDDLFGRAFALLAGPTEAS